MYQGSLLCDHITRWNIITVTHYCVTSLCMWCLALSSTDFGERNVSSFTVLHIRERDSSSLTNAQGVFDRLIASLAITCFSNGISQDVMRSGSVNLVYCRLPFDSSEGQPATSVHQSQPDPCRTFSNQHLCESGVSNNVKDWFLSK